jgi:heme/copper-type cytochrome/quinol oxidase subunit 3
MNINPPEPAPQKKHSILGIASFVSALLFIGCIVLAFVILNFSAPGAPASTLEITLNRIITGCILFLNPLSLVLGVIALFQKKTKKLFAILGISVSLLCCLLMVLTLAYMLVASG